MHTTEYRGLSDNPDTPSPPSARQPPRQNRVTPTGDIIAHPARGTLFGNRGCLHDENGRIVRAHRGRRWIACMLSFKDRRRALMQPGRYTELFFLDEATALAAGHRPCAECRRTDDTRFRDAWARVFGQRPCSDAMDRVLHAARHDPVTGGQRHHMARATSLLDGAMVLIGAMPHLILSQTARPWSPDGYGPPAPIPAGTAVVLTPSPVVALLHAGYRPALHASAT
jgi:hypothetical protein